MKQGLKGTHLATGQPIEIDLTDKEMMYATCKDICINECWSWLNTLVAKRTGIQIIGQIEIDTITDNHIDKAFH